MAEPEESERQEQQRQKDHMTCRDEEDEQGNG
jgi:hypothetical protein